MGIMFSCLSKCREDETHKVRKDEPIKRGASLTIKVPKPEEVKGPKKPTPYPRRVRV